jgi:hypothetical protein
MSRMILMLLLAVVSNIAMASDWVFIDSAGDEQRHFSEYVDSGSIHRNGDMVKMWAMEDNKVEHHIIQGQEYRSIKKLWEIDCKSEQMRVVDTNYFSGHMGSGVPILTATRSTEPRPVSPGSIDELLFKFACGKK